MYQQLWGYKVEEKLYVGVREQKTLNTTALKCTVFDLCQMCGHGATCVYAGTHNVIRIQTV
jgi:hypothetical protein